MRRVRFIAFAWLVVLPCIPAPALGQRSNADALAQQHFERGLVLYDREDYARALESFRASSELKPSPNSSLYIARSYRGLERFDLAAAAYEATVREIRVLDDANSRYAQTAAAAQDELARIDERVGRLILSGDLSPGSSITIGERTIALGMLGLPLPVEPGTVVVTVVDGEQTWEQSVHVSAGQEVDLSLAIPSLDGSATAEEVDGPPIEDSGPDDDGRAPTWPLIGIVGSSVVAATGWALAIGYGIAADDRFASLDQACGGSPCPEELSGAIDGGRTFQTLANVGIALGVLGTSALIVFLVAMLTGDESEVDAPIALDQMGRIRFRGL